MQFKDTGMLKVRLARIQSSLERYRIKEDR